MTDNPFVYLVRGATFTSETTFTSSNGIIVIAGDPSAAHEIASSLLACREEAPLLSYKCIGRPLYVSADKACGHAFAHIP